MWRVVVLCAAAVAVALSLGDSVRAQTSAWRLELTLPGGELYAATFASGEVV